MRALSGEPASGVVGEAQSDAGITSAQDLAQWVIRVGRGVIAGQSLCSKAAVSVVGETRGQAVAVGDAAEVARGVIGEGRSLPELIRRR